MNKKHNFYTMVAAAILMMAYGCTKEQLAFNKLKGNWRYTKAETLGIALDLQQLGYTNATLRFDDCDDYRGVCTGEINLTGTAPVDFQYDLNKEGNEVRVVTNTGTDIYKIEELTKSTLVYTTPTLDTVINGQAVKLDVKFTLDKQ